MTSRFSMAFYLRSGLPVWMHRLGRLAPDLGESLGPAAAPFVVLVTDRILVVIILVVVLGGSEGRGRHNLRRDFLFEAIGDFLLGLLGQSLLLVVVREDDALISGPLVTELAFGIERVDIVPVMVEQRRVADLGGVVGHPDRLFVALMAAVSGVGGGAAGIARHGLGHAIDLVECSLHTPEAAAGEDRALERGGVGVVRSAGDNSCSKERGGGKCRADPSRHHRNSPNQLLG